MAIEDDTLKTLLRIEKLLQASSTTTQSNRPKPKTGGGKDEDASTSKTFKATAAAFGSLNDSATALDKTFNGLSKTVQATRSNFIAMNRTMRAGKNAAGVVNQPARPEAGQMQTPGVSTFFKGLKKPFASMFGPEANARKGLIGLSSGLSYATVGIISMLGQFKGAVLPVVDDFFKLHTLGIQASSSLGGLYLDAARAGMSLSDYTDMLQTSGPAVARALTFDSFNKTLKVSNDQLATLGIFGKSASQLSATLANSATTLGIPQAQLGKAMSAQINTFEQLRKTTLLTADGFKTIITELSNMDEVQNNLLGLSGQERSARMTELAQIQTLGLTMGSTEEASRALGKAIIEQRKMSAPERFKTAGVARQAGAILGMNASDVEAYAKARQAKNPNAEQAAIIARVGGQMETGLQQMLNSGNIQQEYIAEQLKERFGAGDQALGAAGKVALTASSGPIQNKELGKGASTLVQGAGMLLTYAKGLMENPIGSAIVGALGSAAFNIGLGMAISKALGKLSMFRTGTKAVTAGAEVAAGTGFISSIGKTVKSAYDVTKNGITGLMDLVSRPIKVLSGEGFIKDIQLLWTTMKSGWLAMIDGFQVVKGFGGKLKGIGDTVKGFFTTVRELLPAGGDILSVLGKSAGVFGKLIKWIPVFGNIIGMVVDGIGEVITGNVSAAFNADGGGWLERIGNVVFAAINGIFGGIFGLVDSAIKFFGGDGLGLENAWDKFAAMMRGGFFQTLASIAKVVTLGTDNKLSTYFQDAADNSFKVVEQLVNDSSATIASIGEKNRKSLDQQTADAKQTTMAVDATTKSIAASAGLITDTKNLTSQLIGSAQAVIASPGQTTRSSITQPAINTPVETAAQTLNQQLQVAATAQPGLSITDALQLQFATIIDLLQKSLVTEQNQETLIGKMVGAASQPIFSNTTDMIDKVR